MHDELSLYYILAAKSNKQKCKEQAYTRVTILWMKNKKNYTKNRK